MSLTFLFRFVFVSQVCHWNDVLWCVSLRRKPGRQLLLDHLPAVRPRDARPVHLSIPTEQVRQEEGPLYTYVCGRVRVYLYHIPGHLWRKR